MALTAGTQRTLLNIVCVDKRLHTAPEIHPRHGGDKQFCLKKCLDLKVCINKNRYDSASDFQCVVGY